VKTGNNSRYILGMNNMGVGLRICTIFFLTNESIISKLVKRLKGYVFAVEDLRCVQNVVPQVPVIFAFVERPGHKPILRGAVCGFTAWMNR
jgi:hypothetical protein